MSKRIRRIRPGDWPAWFEPKSYPHFDRPIRDPARIRHLVESPDYVARHPFLPFIRFEKMARKYKRDQGGFVKKPRPLSYASHTDSQIFRRYCMLLSAMYEELLAKEAIGDSVLAYRRFDPPQCNIHFANAAFGVIESLAPCVAMAYDVKDFFESLNHRRLKQQWKRVLGVLELPADHYAVLKAVTRYAMVERDALFQRFGITKKKQATWRGPICSPKQFREMVRTDNPAKRLIKVKTDGVGVPQGSPISALLSNIYMIPVDLRMARSVKANGGIYYRYSDDILIVCPLENGSALAAELGKEMESVGLELHKGPGKSTIATFTPSEHRPLNCDRPLQYLGFTFDGKHVRVRSQTIARYMRRMRKAVRREKYLAKQRVELGGEPKVRRKLLYSRYSHLGRQNFISYTKKAEEVFKNSKIRAQIGRFWHDLHALLVID